MARSVGLSALGGHDLSLSALGGLYPAQGTSAIAMDARYKAIPKAPTSAGFEEPLPGDSDAFVFIRLPIQQPPRSVRASPTIQPSVVLSQP